MAGLLPPCLRRRRPGLLALCLALGLAPGAAAQDDLEDVFGGFGTRTREEAAEMRPGEGAVVGRVVDGESGAPIANATVILVWPAPADGGEPPQDVRVSAGDGSYEFPSVPPGRYTLSFIKAGYRASDMTDFEVVAGQENRADFPMPPLPASAGGEVLELEAFVVEASTVDEMLSGLELRMESDQMLNVMSADDLSRYAASDVADALKRVAGVNVVEGKFAFIRGLEDRYSSTTYNGAPIPSPDPNRQSVQLDLFPSEVVGNLVVAKSFVEALPGNSASGSVDILTAADFPETIQLKLKGGAGYNENAVDRFMERIDGSPIGTDVDGGDVVESEYGAFAGGRFERWSREFRFKALYNREIDYETEAGWQEEREPNPPVLRPASSGDLSLGRMTLTTGRYDRIQSDRTEQDTGYAGFGFDLDADGLHRIGASYFFTKKEEQSVALLEHGYLPGFDYGPVRARTLAGGEITITDFGGGRGPSRVLGVGSRIAPGRLVPFDLSSIKRDGAAWFADHYLSRSFLTERALQVAQLNGEHTFGFLDDLELSWAGNFATTTQDQQGSGLSYFFEPFDRTRIPTSFPVTPASFGAPGAFIAVNDLVVFNRVEIEEQQYFARADLDYQRSLTERVLVAIGGGVWYETAEREVTAEFLDTPAIAGSTEFELQRPTPEQLGPAVFDPVAGLLRQPRGRLGRVSENESDREVSAGYVGIKGTLLEDVDLLGGVRFERIRIESRNDPFTGEVSPISGIEGIFPNQYVFFDRLDNPTRGAETPRTPPADTVFNDQILGIDVPRDFSTTACDPPGSVRGCVDITSVEQLRGFIDGEIDELEILPSGGVAFRPLDGLTLRGAYSQTVARPSFREMGYYLSTEPDKTQYVVGNPKLGLSEVENWDARVEYLPGDVEVPLLPQPLLSNGDLFAVSYFRKTIQDPIEAIQIRDPVNVEFSDKAIFRTFFNNPNEARVWGIEVEARKHLGFLGHSFLDYFSVGGNYSYIEARVERTEIELARAQPFFGVSAGDVASHAGLERERRLAGQPEWIANADVGFDHPDWGTKLTLSWFAISDVLETVGGAKVTAAGETRELALDEYNDSFHQLDLVASQSIPLPWDAGTLGLRFVLKNLTDSVRRVIYDPSQLDGRFTKRETRTGRDYALSASWTYEF